MKGVRRYHERLERVVVQLLANLSQGVPCKLVGVLVGEFREHGQHAVLPLRIDVRRFIDARYLRGAFNVARVPRHCRHFRSDKEKKL